MGPERPPSDPGWAIALNNLGPTPRRYPARILPCVWLFPPFVTQSDMEVVLVPNGSE